MNKNKIIGTLILITLLLISSQIISEVKSESNKNVVQEDELVLEDWMTEPFITDTVKTESHV
jgi:hypothetical protein